MNLSNTNVKVGRVGGVLFRTQVDNELPVLVLFNQWRSGAHSLFSKYLAELVLQEDVYGAVLFLDRIASGGASDNTLSADDRKKMQRHADYLFASEYAAAIKSVCAEHKLPKQFVVGGSSAGVVAATATAAQFSADTCLGLVLIEPGGLRSWGFGSSNKIAFAHAMSNHIYAYRHRLQRGWWTPMDREQYFAGGPMFEYRAQYLATDRFLDSLVDYVKDRSRPKALIVLSKTSHAHRPVERERLRNAAVGPHVIQDIRGNHDKICQPPSLTKHYNSARNTTYPKDLTKRPGL